MHVITLVTPEQLPAARALGRSLVREQPGWTHRLVLLGQSTLIGGSSDGEAIESVAAVCPDLDLDIEALLALHDGHELSALLVPILLARVSQASSAPVLHLPSSAWVLGPLEPIETALAERDVLLVARMTAALPDDGLGPSRRQAEAAGRIEQDFMGVTTGEHAAAFLSWWREHVERTLGSLDTRRAGERPEDRQWLARYLELAPARFGTALLDDPGCNLNMWNLHRHTLELADGTASVDRRWRARLLNLPGFDPERPHRLGPGASRARVSRSPLLHELCERYATELRECGWHDEDHHAQVGRRLAADLVYDDSLRAIYRTALTLGEPIGDLFSDSSAEAFLAWLLGPAPRGAEHGINRYVFHRVARERPDVVRAYPDLAGADGPAYVEWCWAFGRHELSIPTRFMPPRPGGARAAAGSTFQPAASGVQVAAQAAGGGRRSAPEARPAAGEEDVPAVRLTGYLGHTLGLGAAARGYAQALSAAGLPVTTVSIPLHHLALPVDLEHDYGRHGFDELVHEGAHGVELIAVNADELPGLVERVGESYFVGPRIGVWGWETDSIPPRWQRAFALIDEIWVYSQFMAENIGAAAPVPVIALPPPVKAPSIPVAPLRLGVPEGFMFLFVFDYLSTVQRKNPVGLIEAFKRAFAPGEGPALLIKTINAPLRPLAEEELLWAAHGREDVHVIDRSLSGEELAGVMAACDCYISLHRAEGFGLTMAEAMSIAKPVIATGYSGNVDFMNAENSYLVDYAIGRVGPDCEIYPPEGTWAEPSLEHAAELMRHVSSQPRDAAAKGERARADIARLLSPEATGERMRRRLEGLLEPSGRGASLSAATR